MTEMFGEAWPPMSVPDLATDDDDDMLSLDNAALILMPYHFISLCECVASNLVSRNDGCPFVSILLGRVFSFLNQRYQAPTFAGRKLILLH